jgi:hypothetical protein
MLRCDDLYAVAQGAQHPGRAQHIARFASGVKPGKARRDMRGQNHLQANLGRSAWIGKRLGLGPQQPTFDGKQEQGIG